MPNLNPQTLIDAIEANDLNKVNSLLRQMQPSWRFGSTDRFRNYVTANDNAALRSAVDAFGVSRDSAVKLAIVNRLLEISYIRDHAAAHHNEAFYKAVEFNQPEVVRKLLQIPSVRAKAYGYENKALHLAAQQNFPNVLNELLQITEIVNIEIAHDLEFPTALELAIKSRSRLQSLPHTDAEDTAIILLQNPRFRAHAANTNNRGLSLALKFNDSRLVTELLNIDEVKNKLHSDATGSSSNSNSRYLFLEAARIGNINNIRSLIPYVEEYRDKLDLFYDMLLQAIANTQIPATEFILEQPGMADHARAKIMEKVRNNPDELTPPERGLARYFHINLAPENLDQIDTHTASIHRSVSESAERLLERYRVADFTAAMADLTELFAKQMPKLIASIAAIKKKPATEFNIDQVQKDITRSIARILNNEFIINGEPFKDPTSGITLDSLLKSTLVGINQLDNVTITKEGDTTLREDAYIQLCSSIYLLQNEYGSNSPSCPPGFFNAITYSQQTTLPNEVMNAIQTREQATTVLQAKLRNFAKPILEGNDFANADEFEAKVAEIANTKNAGMDIMRDLVDEFHSVFKFNTAAEAKQATSEEIEALTVEVFGCTTSKLFTDTGFDFEKLFNNFRNAPAASSASRPRLRSR